MPNCLLQVYFYLDFFLYSINQIFSIHADLNYTALLFFLPFHFLKIFSKTRRVEGNSNFEITISFHFYINFRNCYFISFLLLSIQLLYTGILEMIETKCELIFTLNSTFLVKNFPSKFLLLHFHKL